MNDIEEAEVNSLRGSWNLRQLKNKKLSPSCYKLNVASMRRQTVALL